MKYREFYDQVTKKNYTEVLERLTGLPFGTLEREWRVLIHAQETSMKKKNGANKNMKPTTDPGNIGREELWFDAARPDAQDAQVPGIIQQVFPGYHGVVRYWHSFRMTGCC